MYVWDIIFQRIIRISGKMGSHHWSMCSAAACYVFNAEFKYERIICLEYVNAGSSEISDAFTNRMI